MRCWNIANTTTAITPNSAPSLKRRAPSPELSDSENVDPNILDQSGKRKRTANDDDVSLSKPSRYSLHIVPSAKPAVVTPSSTARLDTFQKPATPLSAPAAAGRSPTKGKRMGLLQPRKRFGPPSLGSKAPSLSITAALNGTLGHKKAKKLRTIEETKPKSWFFDIFEESEEQQDYKMNEWTMTQSATGLDISDDEGKMQEKTDKGKENVDPNEIYTAPVTRSAATVHISTVSKVSRKDAMLDEPRTPLGDLNPAEFYAEGLDATSVILVHDDAAISAPTPASASSAREEVQPEQPALAEPKPETHPAGTFTFEASEKLPAESFDKEEGIHAILAASKPTWEALQSPVVAVATNDDFPTGDSGSIEIWESESAKDEEEVVDVKFDEAEGFALQEL